MTPTYRPGKAIGSVRTQGNMFSRKLCVSLRATLRPSQILNILGTKILMESYAARNTATPCRVPLYFNYQQFFVFFLLVSEGERMTVSVCFLERLVVSSSVILSCFSLHCVRLCALLCISIQYVLRPLSLIHENISFLLFVLIFSPYFSCGNLNFARRTHCNICNKHRHSTQLQNRSLSPRRDYFPSPPPHHRSSPVRVLGLPPERALHREPVRYHRSPPRDWALDAGPFNPRGERLVRADLLECSERGSRFGWQGNEESTRRDRGVRDGLLLETRRGRRSISPLHGRFARDLQGRNRPIADRNSKFVGTARGDGDFGGGYRSHRGDSYNGRSRGDGKVVSRGRSGNAY
jgi:hypothetical protein